MEDPDWSDAYPRWLHEYFYRLKATARAIARHFRDDRLADIVFSNFIESARTSTLRDTPTDPMAFAAYKMKLLAVDEYRRQRRRDEIPLTPDIQSTGEGQEGRTIARSELRRFVDDLERTIQLLEQTFGERRQDFRKRVGHMLGTFRARPERYFDETSGVRVSVFAADLGWEPNAFQKFRARVDEVLCVAPVTDPATGVTRIIRCKDIFHWIYFADRVDKLESATGDWRVEEAR